MMYRFIASQTGDTGKFRKYIDILLTIELLICSVIVAYAINPWSGVFPEPLYIWVRIATPLFLLIGCIGRILHIKNMVFFGVIGSWLFVVVTIGTLVPNEEYFLFVDKELPSKDFVVIRLICSTIVAILLLGGFRFTQAQMKKMEKIKT